MENTLADTFWVLWIAYKSTKWQHLTTRWPFNSRKTKTSRKVCWTSSFLRRRSQAPRVVPEWERFAPKCNRRLWWRMTFSDEKQSNRENLSTISRQLSSWVELGKDEGTWALSLPITDMEVLANLKLRLLFVKTREDAKRDVRQSFAATCN